LVWRAEYFMLLRIWRFWFFDGTTLGVRFDELVFGIVVALCGSTSTVSIEPNDQRTVKSL
jgi:hypothetical protein